MSATDFEVDEFLHPPGKTVHAYILERILNSLMNIYDRMIIFCFAICSCILSSCCMFERNCKIEIKKPFNIESYYAYEIHETGNMFIQIPIIEPILHYLPNCNGEHRLGFASHQDEGFCFPSFYKISHTRHFWPLSFLFHFYFTSENEVIITIYDCKTMEIYATILFKRGLFRQGIKGFNLEEMLYYVMDHANQKFDPVEFVEMTEEMHNNLMSQRIRRF